MRHPHDAPPPDGLDLAINAAVAQIEFMVPVQRPETDKTGCP